MARNHLDGGGARVVVDAAAPGALGGSGQRASVDAAAAVARQVPVILAGGLEPASVGEALRAIPAVGVDVASGAIAQHARPRDLQAEQRLHGAVSPELREEAEQHVEDQHGTDRRRVEAVARDKGDSRRGDEQRRHHAAQLSQQDPPRRHRAGGAEDVRTITFEPASGLGGRQTVRTRAEDLKRLLGRNRVPGRRLRR